MSDLIIFGLVNTVVMTLSGISGGGAGLFTAPFLIALGFNPLTSIATSKVTGVGAAIGAGAKYKQQKILNIKEQMVFMCIGVVGALIGSTLLVKFSSYEDVIEKLLGIVIIFVGIPLLLTKNLGIEKRKTSSQLKGFGFLLVFFVSIMAAVMSGLTSMYLIIMMWFFGMTAIEAAMAKRSIQVIAQTVSLIIFGLAGFIDYKLAIVALLTSIIGCYIGAHIAIKKGNKFVINVFAVLCVALALQMIFG